MRRVLPVAAAVLTVAAGCAAQPDPAQPDAAGVSTTVSSPAPTTPAAADPAQLPAPDALSDVLVRLADPAVPGTDKVTLVHNGAAPDAPVIERFSAALRDGGYLPLTVSARDLRWSDTVPGDVVATVTLTGPAPQDSRAGRAPEFSFPMEFSPAGPGWQLTRDTADSLLAFGGR